ncbi:helix-turn-helix domain-containing protein, partial [Escherichia coli]|uniref:helix-turn-helix domain-containing protein n=1 Tax=Escherichia coli TaxID=562 RepID=UPI001CDB27AB
STSKTPSYTKSVSWQHHLQHAKNLIRVEGSVNKIAEQCGYASTSYFIYAFRKHFGNSPKRVSKEYRCQSHTGMNTGNTMNALAI